MNYEEIDFTDPEMLRKKAEELLSAKQRKTNSPELESDIKKLLHELQVHQIELEMQNEELRLAHETTGATLKRYTILYDFAPMGYFTLDPTGSILELNFTGADILGEKRFSLLDSNFKLFVSEESRPEFNTFFKKVFISNVKESCEIKLGYNNNPLCQVYMEGIVLGDEPKCLLSIVDVSKFK